MFKCKTLEQLYFINGNTDFLFVNCNTDIDNDVIQTAHSKEHVYVTHPS